MAKAMTMALSTAQHQALLPFAALLRQWNEKINLVSPHTLQHLEQRHLADCAQLLPFLGQAQRVLDVGTGAGLPGLVLALLDHTRHYTLVESDSRKAAFLITAQQNLQLKHVTVLNQRVEALPPTLQADVITARAFAPLTKILALTHSFLAPQGQWLLLKGEAVDAEIKVCETLFPMTITRTPSIVPGTEGAQGWVVHITPQVFPRAS